MSNLEYKQLTLADVEQAAQVIAHAFVGDPLISFMLPNEQTRVETLLKFFRAYGEICIKNGRGFGVGEPLQGVAFWKFPAQESLSVGIRPLGKFLPLLFTAYPFGFIRTKAILDQIDILHERHAHEAHFYLDNLGVIPSVRGKGLSSKLIRPFLQMADEQRVIAYTDTVTPSNVPLYEHFGFICVETSEFPNAGITVYALRRPVKGVKIL